MNLCVLFISLFLPTWFLGFCFVHCSNDANDDNNTDVQPCGEIKLSVYRLLNAAIEYEGKKINVEVFHWAYVCGVEYHFGVKLEKIFQTAHKNGGHPLKGDWLTMPFHDTLSLGNSAQTNMSKEEVDKIVEIMGKTDWSIDKLELFVHGCLQFTEQLINKIAVNSEKLVWLKLARKAERLRLYVSNSDKFDQLKLKIRDKIFFRNRSYTLIRCLSEFFNELIWMSMETLFFTKPD